MRGGTLPPFPQTVSPCPDASSATVGDVVCAGLVKSGWGRLQHPGAIGLDPPRGVDAPGGTPTMTRARTPADHGRLRRLIDMAQAPMPASPLS